MEPNRTTVAIRDAGASDREAVRQVTLAAYQEYAETMPPLFWEGYRKNIMEALDETAPAQQIVATHTGMVVGGVLLYRRCACWRFIRRCVGRGLALR
jgi:hypothetical protein